MKHRKKRLTAILLSAAMAVTSAAGYQPQAVKAETAGYDEKGLRLRRSDIRFTDTSEFPESIEGATYTVSRAGTSRIFYRCDNFSVTSPAGKEVFVVRDGRIHYQDEEKTELELPVPEANTIRSESMQGVLYLQGSGYTVYTESEGYISFSENGMYKGVHIVLQTTDDTGYVAVGVDADIASGDSVFSLKDNIFTCDTEIAQNLTIHVEDKLAGETTFAVDTSKKSGLQGEAERENTEPEKVSVLLNMDKPEEDKTDAAQSYQVGMHIADSASNAMYKITKLTKTGGTLEYVSPISNDIKKAVIGKNIQTIGKQSFYGCKNLKYLAIKTKKLTKVKVGKEAFRKINAKAVIKVPKKKLDFYTKILKSKGLSRKAVIRQ